MRTCDVEVVDIIKVEKEEEDRSPDGDTEVLVSVVTDTVDMDLEVDGVSSPGNEEFGSFKEELDGELEKPKWYPVTDSNPYIRAIEICLRSSLESNGHLFTATEKDNVQRFLALSCHARLLYTRFFVRKVKCLRKVDYAKYLAPEYLDAALDELKDADPPFLVTGFEYEHLISVLTIKELTTLAKTLRVKSGSGKNGLRQALLRHVSCQSTIFGGSRGVSVKVTKTINETHGPFYMINSAVADPFRIMVRAYLAPCQAALNEVIQANMRLIAFPEYEISNAQALFPSRQVLDEYLAAADYAEDIELNWPSWSATIRDKKTQDVIDRATTAVLLSDLDAHKSAVLRRYTPNYMYISTLLAVSELIRPNHGIELECLTLYCSQTVYRPEKRAVYLTRKAHLELAVATKDAGEVDRLTDSLNSCINAISHWSLDDISRMELHRKIVKVRKEFLRTKREFPEEILLDLKPELLEPPVVEVIGNQTVVASAPGLRTRWKGEEDESISVEEVALRFYGAQGWRGVHSESSILNHLYALLFWDILFGGDLEVFYHPYQSRPIDLLTQQFYTARKDVIDEHLQKIEEGGNPFVVETIREVLTREAPRNTYCIGIHWKYTTEDILDLADCIPIKGIVTICRLYAQSYRTSCSGGPDLCLWMTEKRQCRFVEVKSVNDTLSDNQRVWMHHLLSAGVPVDLCRVLSEKSGKRKRKD